MDEGLQTEGDFPTRLLELVRDISRESHGRLILGGKLFDIWRREIWSHEMELGPDGLEVAADLESRIPDVARLSEESRAAYKSFRDSEPEMRALALRAQEEIRASKLNLKAYDMLGLLQPGDALLAQSLGRLLSAIGETSNPTVILRNRSHYRAIMTWVALHSFCTQADLIPKDHYTKFPEDAQAMLGVDRNHAMDMLIASACAYCSVFVTEDQTLRARLAFLRDCDFPVPPACSLDEFFSTAHQSSGDVPSPGVNAKAADEH